MKYRSKRVKTEDEWFDEKSTTATVVIEQDEEWTGLLDENGNGIYRVKDRIGFR